MKPWRNNRYSLFLKVVLLTNTILCMPIGGIATAQDIMPQVAAGYMHTVGLKTDGTVLAEGANGYGQCNVQSWADIVHIAAGMFHTVGVKSNGEVLAVGENQYGQCDVQDWTNIVQVAAGWKHTVGLRGDGTVVAVGECEDGECDVESWSNIVQISARGFQTLGLKTDGKVLTTYGTGYEKSWSDIVQIAAGDVHSMGLVSNGTVEADGCGYGACIAQNWTDMVHLAAGGWHNVGVKSNGRVEAVGTSFHDELDVESWRNIIQVAAGGAFDFTCAHTVGLKADGRVVAVGCNAYGQCDLSDWDLIPGDASMPWLPILLLDDGVVPTCTDNSECTPSSYCEKDPGDCMGEGRCTERPVTCPLIYWPVCGCNGQTYSNSCFAAANGVNVAHVGACPP